MKEPKHELVKETNSSMTTSPALPPELTGFVHWAKRFLSHKGVVGSCEVIEQFQQLGPFIIDSCQGSMSLGQTASFQW